MEIKQIIAPYIGLSESEILSSTNISKKALKSSIFLHRMYGKLAEEGYVISDYSNIETYGELHSIINGVAVTIEKDVIPSKIINENNEINNTSVGIDVQDIEELPKVNDFRTDGFYIENFTNKEISYCILQKNAYASFAGLFAAKEAIIKADNSFKKTKLNQIEIKHDEKGKPTFNGFAISISHNNTSATSVAVYVVEKQQTVIVPSSTTNVSSNIILLILSIAAIVISCIALLIKR
jgi:phosphopantetheine--protein transferase-like protein